MASQYPMQSQMTAAILRENELRNHRERTSTASKVLISMAFVQIVTALIVIGFGVYRLLQTCENGGLVTGIWTGAVIMASGLLGIIAGLSRDEKSLSSFLVLTLLTALLASVLMVIEGLSLSSEIKKCDPSLTTCQPGCLIGSTCLVLLGLFHFCLGSSLAYLSTRITRRGSAIDSMVMPLWTVPSVRFGSDFNQREPREEEWRQRVSRPEINASDEHNQDGQTKKNHRAPESDQYNEEKFLFP